jgi:hypothetical protein
MGDFVSMDEQTHLYMVVLALLFYLLSSYVCV